MNIVARLRGWIAALLRANVLPPGGNSMHSGRDCLKVIFVGKRYVFIVRARKFKGEIRMRLQKTLYNCTKKAYMTFISREARKIFFRGGKIFEGGGKFLGGGKIFPPP